MVFQKVAGASMVFQKVAGASMVFQKVAGDAMVFQKVVGDAMALQKALEALMVAAVDAPNPQPSNDTRNHNSDENTHTQNDI